MRIHTKSFFCIIIAMHLFFVPTQAKTHYDFYVSPSGNDNNTGTKEAPFASLEKAKMAVRAFKKTVTRDIRVGIETGPYFLKKTVVFGLEDAGNETQKITYEAIEKGNAIFTSEIPVTSWKKVRDVPPGVPKASQNNIWVASYPSHLSIPKYLFQGNRQLPVSKSASFLPEEKYATWRGDGQRNPDGTCDSRSKIKIPKSIINYSNIQDKELSILPTCDWTHYNLPLKAIDQATGKAEVAVVSAYGLGQLKKVSTWGHFKNAWINNCPEGMLKEGDWYADRKNHLIYFHSTQRPHHISLPTLLEYIRIEGETSRTTKTDKMVENLHFKGLVFTHGQRYTWAKDHVKKNVQHEWDRYDVSNALVRLRSAKNCSVVNCTFENSGAVGLRMDLSAQNNRVEGNVFQRLGGTGIFLCGYGIGYKDQNYGNHILNNHIHHIGEAYWHSSAILVFQSGRNHIAHNLIHHTPYNGITVTGPRDLAAGFIESGQTSLVSIPKDKSKDWTLRFKLLHAKENIIEYNELYKIVMLLGDGNAIYTSGAGEKNQYRYNYIHDCEAKHISSAMRTDAYARDQYFIGNIIYNVGAGALALKDAGHKAIGNFMIDCINNEHAQKRSFITLRGGPNDGTEVKNNVIYNTKGKKHDPSFIAVRQSRVLAKVTPEVVDFDGNITSESATVDIKNSYRVVEKESIHSLFQFLEGGEKISINEKHSFFQQGVDYVDINKMGPQGAHKNKIVTMVDAPMVGQEKFH